MTPTAPSPSSAETTPDLSNLTESGHYPHIPTDDRRFSPPWMYFLCGLWFLLAFYFALSNMLPPHRRLSHYLRVPDRMFRWTPGKEKFDLEWEVKENIRKGEEQQRKRVFAEENIAFPPPLKLAGKSKGRVQAEEIELSMFSPRKRS